MTTDNSCADALTDAEAELLTAIKHFRTREFGRGPELHSDAISDAYKHGRRAASPVEQHEAAPADEPTIPAELHHDTTKLVRRFARALANKLLSAQRKYGYSDNWMRDDWADECRTELMRHIDKGDPRDVAAYCAFLWHHNESTAPAQAAEPVAWRELARRLYVELFHCDQQMRSTRDEDGEPHWTQSSVVRNVLADAKAALDASPPPPAPASAPVGLSDVDILARANSYDLDNAPRIVAFARALLAALPGQPEPFTLASALEWAGVPDACRKDPGPRAEVTAWQPIETAPRDGTEVVLLFGDEVDLLGKTRPRVRAASWLVDWTIPYRRDNPPTHWMPLPAAPIDGRTHDEFPEVQP